MTEHRRHFQQPSRWRSYNDAAPATTLPPSSNGILVCSNSHFIKVLIEIEGIFVCSKLPVRLRDGRLHPTGTSQSRGPRDLQQPVAHIDSLLGQNLFDPRLRLLDRETQHQCQQGEADWQRQGPRPDHGFQ
jgi:hypothetical protein